MQFQYNEPASMIYLWPIEVPGKTTGQLLSDFNVGGLRISIIIYYRYDVFCVLVLLATVMLCCCGVKVVDGIPASAN